MKRVPVSFEHVNDYVIGTIVRLNGDTYKFIFDSEDYEKAKGYKWHIVAGYVGTDVIEDNRAKVLYLHNFVMNKLTFDGRGQKETVDHINRNPLDNRKCNLRIASAMQQLLNQRKKSRRVVLPPYYTLNPNDLPKNVFYVSARGNHGDGFCVEFKMNGKKIYNPYIRSKVLTIEEKLEKIKVLLQKGYELYPEFNPDYEKELRDKLDNEYQQIIALV
jgi:hypothetical protein